MCDFFWFDAFQYLNCDLWFKWYNRSIASHTKLAAYYILSCNYHGNYGCEEANLSASCHQVIKRNLDALLRLINGIWCKRAQLVLTNYWQNFADITLTLTKEGGGGCWKITGKFQKMIFWSYLVYSCISYLPLVTSYSSVFNIKVAIIKVKMKTKVYYNIIMRQIFHCIKYFL